MCCEIEITRYDDIFWLNFTCKYHHSIEYLVCNNNAKRTIRSLWVHILPEWESKVAQLYLTLCDPVDYSPPGSSIHGILQARILEWVAISFSRGCFRPNPALPTSEPPGKLRMVSMH